MRTRREIALHNGTLAFIGPGLMGVVNVTPDSFSDGGLHASHEAAIEHGNALASAGAVVLDIGGESTRPGAARIAPEAEQERILPVISALSAAGHTVSVDTRNASTAHKAIAAGAQLVNDIAGFRDEAMQDMVAQTGVAVVAMHMQGDPTTMQINPTYTDVVAEVRDYLAERVEFLSRLGAASVIIDPGIGFGKRLAHNLALLTSTSELAQVAPVLVGASRKSFIHQIVPAPIPHDRLGGTLAAHAYAAKQGATLLRVHDVAEHVQYLRVAHALEEHHAY